MSKDYRVLLYYKYQSIEDPEAFKNEHLAFTKSIGLKGRVLVSAEGFNGTVSGTIEQIEKYKDYVHSLPGFEDTWFKEDQADDYAHKKMHVRHNEEIVSLKLEDNIDPKELTAEFLEPKEFRDAILDDETIVLDARNDYEYDLGHFKGAVRPDIRNFRDLPDWIMENKEQFMDKKVVMYCTGGIRCEKFSGWFAREGITDKVGQLKGGIDTYGKDPETKGELWEGKMYVFDERMAVPINQENPTVVGKDIFDGSPCERHVNCTNPDCHEQIFMSEENEHKYLRGCSAECRKDPRNRYVKEHGLSESEWEARLNKIGESLYEETTVQ